MERFQEGGVGWHEQTGTLKWQLWVDCKWQEGARVQQEPKSVLWVGMRMGGQRGDGETQREKLQSPGGKVTGPGDGLPQGWLGERTEDRGHAGLGARGVGGFQASKGSHQLGRGLRA